MTSKQPRSVCALILSTRRDLIVAAEGIDKSGKGVLRIAFVPLSETGPRALDNQKDAASTSLRIPVDAVEMMGFSRAEDDKVGLPMKVCTQRVT